MFIRRFSAFFIGLRKSLLVEAVRSVLFLVFFLISLSYSFKANGISFWIVIGGIILYAVTIILEGIRLYKK